MVESLTIPKTDDKQKIYNSLIPQIESLILDEDDLVANQANIVAVLKEAFNFLWVGFYWVKDLNRVDNDLNAFKKELVLGPFQGPIACTRIAFDRGVCGYAYRTKKTVIVPNVEQFPGHIACSSRTKSEIVVPVINSHGEVLGVLDVDSQNLNDFDEMDQMGLEGVVKVFLKNLER